MGKQQLGPIQLKWIEELEAHPERQISGRLGIKTSYGVEKMCCLGQGGLIAGVCEWDLDLRVKGKINGDAHTLSSVYTELGLYDNLGKFVNIVGSRYNSLSEMNDNGLTWLEIAKYMRENPENIFEKSV